MTMNVTDAIMSRRSVRAFEERAVPQDVLRQIMDTARWSPSGCNFQPWEATILSGAPLKALQDKICAAAPQSPEEYAVTPAGITPTYMARLQELGAAMYGAQGIERSDADRRADFVTQNNLSFGAPALLLVYFPRFMGPPQWSDVGMWMQSIMLLLREAGLDSCPQEYLSLHGKLIKEHIGVSDESHIFFCGLAIGYGKHEAPVNGFVRQRVPVEDHVQFIGF